LSIKDFDHCDVKKTFVNVILDPSDQIEPRQAYFGEQVAESLGLGQQI
jgi:hypothetical protein